MAEGETPTVEELADQLAAFKVDDFLVSSASTLVAIAFGKLDVGKPEEAQLAIEALRALLPVLGPAAPEQTRRDLQQALANLQLAYAAAVSAPQEPAPEDSPPQEPAPEDSPPQDSAPQDSAPQDSAPQDDDPPAAAAGPDQPDPD